jgi:hypothetical protein
MQPVKWTRFTPTGISAASSSEIRCPSLSLINAIQRRLRKNLVFTLAVSLLRKRIFFPNELAFLRKNQVSNASKLVSSFFLNNHKEKPYQWNNAH